MTTYNTIADFNNALALAKTNLPAIMLPLVNQAQKALAGEIRARVSVQGETSTGGQFSAYSKGHVYKKKKYGESALGKKVDKKNFYFSGKMWGSFGVTRISIQGQRIVSNMGFLGQSGYLPTAELNDIHSERENKGIAFPNKEEEDVLVAAIEEALFQSLDKLL